MVTTAVASCRTEVMAQSPSPCAAEQKNGVRWNTTKEGRAGRNRGGGETHGGGVEEREASRAAGRAEAGVDGGVAVEVRAAAELLLVHLPRSHGGGGGCAAAARGSSGPRGREASMTRAGVTPVGGLGPETVHGLGRCAYAGLSGSPGRDKC